MKAGQMDRKIIIQTPAESVNDIGQVVSSWSTLATVWAQVVPVTGNEIIRSGSGGTSTDTPGGKLFGSQQSRVFVRYRSDVTIQERLSIDGQYWDIQYIRVVSAEKRKDGLEILAVKYD